MVISLLKLHSFSKLENGKIIVMDLVFHYNFQQTIEQTVILITTEDNC